MTAHIGGGVGPGDGHFRRTARQGASLRARTRVVDGAMPLLLLVLLVSVFLYLWLARRGTTLTRACRWRRDRAAGPDRYLCAYCGARCEGSPKHCLRPR